MGLTWSEADKDRKEHNFSLAACQITLTFVFDHNGDNRFTRIIDDKKPPALVADFGTLTLPSPVLLRHRFESFYNMSFFNHKKL